MTLPAARRGTRIGARPRTRRGTSVAARRRSAPIVPCIGMLLVGVLSIGCQPTQEPGAAQRPSVLLVTVDALRCDVLMQEAQHDGLLPRLSELHARPHVWSGCAVAASSVPETALASLLTGVDPITLGRRAAEPGSRVGGLAPLFEAQGYRTHALLASPPPPVGGAIEGFQIVERHLGIAEMVEQVAALPGESPWFAWVHLSRTRPPWAVVEAYRPRLAEAERARATGTISRAELADLAQADAPRRQRARLLYRLNLVAVDNQLGLLLDALGDVERRGGLRVAVVGSEGVDLGETSESGFATGLSRPQLEVAMLLLGSAGSSPPVPVDEVGAVSATRLAATLAGWAGFAPPPAMAPALGQARTSPTISVYWTRRGARLSWLEGDRQWLVARQDAEWQTPWSRSWGEAAGGVVGGPEGRVPEELRRRLEGPWRSPEAPWNWSSSEARALAAGPD